LTDAEPIPAARRIVDEIDINAVAAVVRCGVVVQVIGTNPPDGGGG
jgi:hypothetical protein